MKFNCLQNSIYFFEKSFISLKKELLHEEANGRKKFLFHLRVFRMAMNMKTQKKREITVNRVSLSFRGKIMAKIAIYVIY